MLVFESDKPISNDKYSYLLRNEDRMLFDLSLVFHDKNDKLVIDVDFINFLTRYFYSRHEEYLFNRVLKVIAMLRSFGVIDFMPLAKLIEDVRSLLDLSLTKEDIDHEVVAIGGLNRRVRY
jgi:hypothetical protein